MNATTLENPTIKKLDEKQQRLTRERAEAESRFTQAVGEVENEFIASARLRHEAGVIEDLCLDDAAQEAFARQCLGMYLGHHNGDTHRSAEWFGHIGLLGAVPILQKYAPKVAAEKRSEADEHEATGRRVAKENNIDVSLICARIRNSHQQIAAEVDVIAEQS